jgi:hypothetical protein
MPVALALTRSWVAVQTGGGVLWRRRAIA